MTVRSLLPLLAAALLVSGCGGDAEPSPPDDESAALAGVLWLDDTLAEGAVDTCGSLAVLPHPDQDLRVALVEEDRVVVPEVVPPEGSEVVVGRDWHTTGGCVPTADGPVVVVEAQEAYANLYDDAPKVVAGFTADGVQRWAVELPGDFAGNYDGRGSVIFESLDDDEWTVVDAWTGATVASGDEADGAPVTSLSATLVDEIDGGLVDLADGRELGGGGDTTGQVDDGRILLQTTRGVRLVRLPDLKVIWRAQEDIRLTGIWAETADLSTSTIVAFATDGTIVGLDIDTGRVRWTSDVPSDAVNGLDTQVGSGVFVFRRNGEDPLGQVVLDSATGQELTGAEGFVLADQGLLLEVAGGVASPVTVDDLR